MLETDSAAIVEEALFSRNFIDGRWSFPAAPYEFEIRSPLDSSVVAEVPLSSRNEVRRAIVAARRAQDSHWADPKLRGRLLDSMLNELARSAPQLAKLQCIETGLSLNDSTATVGAALRLAEAILANPVGAESGAGGVSGHVLSWGLPFTEMLTSVFGSLSRGMSAVVKPSLRGPLSPVAVAAVSERVGIPPGVLNVVQGTGVDVGAALMGSAELDQLSVHGNSDTLLRAARAAASTGVALSAISAGLNSSIVYPDIDQGQINTLAVRSAAGLRLHSAGGLFGQSTVVVHQSVANSVIDALRGNLRGMVAAPLPSDPLRQCAMRRLGSLLEGGAHLILGGSIPDDIDHRMSWRIPPILVDLGHGCEAAKLLASSGDPLGPILSVIRWTTHSDLDEIFSRPAYLDAYGTTWGNGWSDSRLRFGETAWAQSPIDMALAGQMPQAWRQ